MPKNKKQLEVLSIILLTIIIVLFISCTKSESDKNINNNLDVTNINILKNESSIDINNSLISNINIELNHPAQIYIEYENDRAGKFINHKSDKAKITHEIQLLRLKPNSVYKYKIIAIDYSGKEKIIGDGEFTTLDLPEALKSIDTVTQGIFSSDLLLTEIHIGPPLSLTESYMFIIDKDSEIVWYYSNPNKDTNKPLMILGISQKENYNLVFNLGSPFDYCCIREITPSGKIVDNLPSGPIDGVAHRDHLILDNNKILYSAWEYRKIDDTIQTGKTDIPVAGLTLRIWDQTSGITTEVWNSFNSIGIENRHLWDEALEQWPTRSFYNKQLSVPELINPIPWTSANSLQKSERGNYIVSIVELSQIISISEDFQQIYWTLGGNNSDFRFEEKTNKFYHQHTAQELSNGNILLFDNGNNRPEEEGGNYSRALEITMNSYDRIANKSWEYIPEPKLYSPNRSSAYRLKNGNTLMNFVGNPRTIIEVTDQGNEIYKAIMKTNTDQGSFRVYPISSINGETKIK